MSLTSRPDPDKLLAQMKKIESRSKKGKLKIFFGMCAGVGKTYTMLQDARNDMKDKVDVVIGYVETHGRKETDVLAEGIPLIPRKKILYNNITLEEMDLDSVLERKPKLVLVDELAHTNVPGSRHKKRYLDVLELLDNNIDVYTTLNVQHLESQSGTVASISGITVRETVPDSILDAADEIELIDISPDELLERLAEGKVYHGEKSEKAVENFFKKENLTALREMSLRTTANTVDRQLREYMHEKMISGPWKSGQRIMVAVSPNPQSENVIKWTRSIADTLKASWLALFVETSEPLKDSEKRNIKKSLDLARMLGAEIITTAEDDIVGAILRIAKQENITQIYTGKPGRRSFFSKLFKEDIAEKLIRESGAVDIYLVGSGFGKTRRNIIKRLFYSQSKAAQYFIAPIIVALVAAVCFPFSELIGYQTVSMIFLLTIVILPLAFGPGPVLLSAALSALLWNLLFIPPRFTFSIGRYEDVLMLALYLIIAIVSSILTARIRANSFAAITREKRSVALYNLANDLSAAKSIEEVLNAAVSNLVRVFSCDVAILLADSRGLLFNTYAEGSRLTLDRKEFSVATWVFKNGKKAGRFTDTLPFAEAQYYPLSSARKIFGVAGIKFRMRDELSIEDESLLGSFISQISVVIERELLNEDAKRALFLEESDKLYRNLFDSISHEFKTPISAILGNSKYLMEKNGKNKKENENVIEEIYTASIRLNRLVEELLDMARLESGRFELNKKWIDIRDIINSTLKNLNNELKGYKLSIQIPENTPLVKLDFGLISQVLKNIIYNSTIYTPKGTGIELNVSFDKNYFYISISDNGPGIPEKELQNIFNKFYRAPDNKESGSGLGLSITKGFVEAHKGKITAENRNQGGTRFLIQLPLNE